MRAGVATALFMKFTPVLKAKANSGWKITHDPSNIHEENIMTLTDAEEGAKDELKVNDSAWLKEDECDGAHRDDCFHVQRMLSGPVDDSFQNCNT